MDLTFLGTGGAWSVPELNCDCRICREMLRCGEHRSRPAFLLSGQKTLLMDCGPDIASQLSKQNFPMPDVVLITHEHGDHYMGLDEFYSFKRTSPEDSFEPVPVLMTAGSAEVIKSCFGYLEDKQIIKVMEVEPLSNYHFGEFDILPFNTNHGSFAAGSVGYLIRASGGSGGENGEIQILYTSDFMDLPETPEEILSPDYLMIQSYWLNEPSVNIPRHMSFQRALEFINHLKPKIETFLVHIGDGDQVLDDPANNMLKKRAPLDPMRSPHDGAPYPVPLNQAEWQSTVNRILADRKMPFKITVAYDGLQVSL